VRDRSGQWREVEQFSRRTDYYPRRKFFQAFLRKKQTLSAPENRIQKNAMSRPRLIALLLALTTLLVYLPVTQDGFVNYDDQDYVTDNPTVQNGLTWAGIKWAFTTGHAGNWHPVTWLSHMTDCELFGVNPGAHHFVNVLFHAANVVLLFALLFRLTSAMWPSAFIAALFAWHPLHVESVAWIAERKDVLSTLFALLSLLSYTRFVQQSETAQIGFPTSGLRPPTAGFYWLALFFFALGLMSKPMLVTLPFVLLLLDYWPLQRFPLSAFRFSLLLEKIPFFLLTAISCIITFFVQRNGHAVSTLAMVSLPYRFCNTLAAYGRYLLNMVWPADLAIIYPLSQNLAWLHRAAAISAAALLVISWLVWRGRRTQPYLPVGWLWYLGTLVPVIGLVQVGEQALADRYTYFPLIGIFIAVTFGVAGLAKRFQIPKIILAVAAAVILTACLALTKNQLRYWQDGETLFAHSLAVTQDNETARINLGVALEQKGGQKEALAQYRAAEKMAPGLYIVHNNLGNLLDNLGQPEAALAEYRQAVLLNPGLAFLHNGTGVVLTELGRFNEAMDEFTNALRLDPAYAAPHMRLGDALLKQGRAAEGVVQFREALKLDPGNFQNLAFTAHVLAAIENPDVRDGKTALILAAKANVLTGGNQPLVLDVFGMACAETGHFNEAQELAQKAWDLATLAKLKKTEPIQQRLQLYKNHQPWRESFLATNAPVTTPAN
jgi:protein O-mannosyl-transferase